MTGKNWQFWTNSAIFTPPIIYPAMIKHAIIFPSKVSIVKNNFLFYLDRGILCFLPYQLTRIITLSQRALCTYMYVKLSCNFLTMAIFKCDNV